MPISQFLRHPNGNPRKRVLIIGNEALAFSANRMGIKTSFIPDEDFADRHDQADPRLEDITKQRVPATWLEKAGFRARLSELSDDGIQHPGLSLSSFHSATGALGATIRWHETDPSWVLPTWDALIADTDDPNMHPSLWSRRMEGIGEEIEDNRAIARLIRPGGVFVTRLIERPDEDGAGEFLWRTDGEWAEFLDPYFTAAMASEDGEHFVVAKRNDKHHPGDCRANFQP